MKLLLEKVKIYGFDPTTYKSFTNTDENTGAVTESKQYNVPLYISGEQRALIDSYIYGKCETTKDGEILFYGKSKQPIPVFDQERNKIEKPITDVFLADVSLLIDEFNDKKTGNPVRYSKCLGIKYLSKVENEQARIFVQEKYETFDEIFGNAENKPEIFGAVTKFETKIPVDCSQPTAAPGFSPAFEPPTNDLPF